MQCNLPLKNHASRTAMIRARRLLSFSTYSADDDIGEEVDSSDRSRPAEIPRSAAVPCPDKELEHQRIWRPDNRLASEPLYWSENVIQSSRRDPQNLSSLLDRIEKQE